MKNGSCLFRCRCSYIDVMFWQCPPWPFVHRQQNEVQCFYLAALISVWNIKSSIRMCRVHSLDVVIFKGFTSKQLLIVLPQSLQVYMTKEMCCTPCLLHAQLLKSNTITTLATIRHSILYHSIHHNSQMSYKSCSNTWYVILHPLN